MSMSAPTEVFDDPNPFVCGGHRFVTFTASTATPIEPKEENAVPHSLSDFFSREVSVHPSGACTVSIRAKFPQKTKCVSGGCIVRGQSSPILACLPVATHRSEVLGWSATYLPSSCTSSLTLNVLAIVDPEEHLEILRNVRLNSKARVETKKEVFQTLRCDVSNSEAAADRFALVGGGFSSLSSPFILQCGPEYNSVWSVTAEDLPDLEVCAVGIRVKKNGLTPLTCAFEGDGSRVRIRYQEDEVAFCFGGAPKQPVDLHGNLRDMEFAARKFTPVSASKGQTLPPDRVHPAQWHQARLQPATKDQPLYKYSTDSHCVLTKQRKKPLSQ